MTTKTKPTTTRKRATATVVDNVADTIKPPITFKEFSKDPVKGMLFIVLIAIGYLYVDIKMTNKETVARQDSEIKEYRVKVDTLQNQVKILIEQASAATAKMQMLESLKQISK